MLLNRRDALAVAAAGASLAARATAQPARAAPRRTFTPGRAWLDTSGKPIQAHGGSIIAAAGKYYWYGENKEFTDGKSKIWTWGVRCYVSDDLYNWDDLGLIVPPREDDPLSPLNPRTASLDRPHIVFNPRTKKFVCWLKIMARGTQTRAALTADKIVGPYSLVRDKLQPLGMNAGDFDLAVSPDDGKAYMYFERVHTEMICADLTPDYTDFTGYYSTHFAGRRPPLVREGPAYFRREGKHYLATSGTTSYFPNPSEIAVADTFHGPFRSLGDLHPTDRSRTSFNSQISSVFRHPGKKDLFIALADRWWGDQSGEDFASGRRSAIIRSGISKAMASPRVPLDPEELKAMSYLAGNIDTSKARYVWLPIAFAPDGTPSIAWREEWSLDDFA